MIIDYPSTLPAALSTSYVHSDNEQWRRDKMQGAFTTALLSEHGFASFKLQWVFTQDEFATFEAWYFNDLSAASRSFNISLKAGAGFVVHECHFIPNQSYNATDLGKEWRVNANVIAIQKVYNNLVDFNCVLVLRENITSPLQPWIDTFNGIWENFDDFVIPS